MIQLQTAIDIPRASHEIYPADRLLFVGSCFASNIGQRAKDDNIQTIVNPYGTMYNPASILHTVEKAICDGTIGKEGIDIAIFTLGTNHVYILKETGEIVDNCQKRPQRLFQEQVLSIEDCCGYLHTAMTTLKQLNDKTRFVFTVSPIRYAKYGFHESQLSKATLLLAIDRMIREEGDKGCVSYFPAYEIMNDELRDYRFYQPDMLHPSEQAADYIYQRFMDTYFSEQMIQYITEWRPIQRALNHRPFNPDSEEHKAFLRKVEADRIAFLSKWK